MASISFVRGKWRVQVRNVKPAVSRSFKTEAEARRWKREVEDSAARGQRVGGLGPPVVDLLQNYRQARADAGRPIAPTSTEHYMLARLQSLLLGVRLAQLRTPAIVTLAQRLRKAGAGPYTTAMHVSKLGTALRYACSLQGLDWADPVRAAMPTLTHLRLVGKGAERDRRPTAEEWERLLAWLAAAPSAIPLVDIVELAAITGMRQGEIVRVTWSDFNAKARTLVIRDRKDPREKAGNDQRIPLLFGAADIIARQERIDERIFPFKGPTVSVWFTAACRALEIEDLHFHDLRHEAISRMFERGMGVEEVAAVSGHRDWRHLRRYTQIRPEAIVKRRERSPSRRSPAPRPRNETGAA